MAPNTSRRGFLTLWRRAVEGPSGGHKVPSGAHKLPSGSHKLPSVRLRVPSGRHKLPSSTHKAAPRAPSTPAKAKRESLRPLPPPPVPATELTELATFLLRPPGALPEQEFLDTCQHSGRCVEACPVLAIALVPEGPGAGTPHIDPSVSPCILCSGLQCTRVCPSGALRPLDVPGEVRMGTAEIDPDLCTAYRGLPCRICYEVCSVPGVLTITKGKEAYVPLGGSQPCVGCGACQFYCPAEGAIRIVPLVDGVLSRVRIAKHGAMAAQRRLEPPSDP